jgi:hypothetical protein
MVWVLPLSILVIALGATEIKYGWPTRTSMALITGEIMAAVTLVLALVQRFYYKIKS